MKYYVINEAKNGLKLFLANLKETNGDKWTFDIEKSFYFYSENDALLRAKYNQKVVDEKFAKKASCENLSLKIMGV